MRKLLLAVALFALAGCIAREYRLGVPVRDSQIAGLKAAGTKAEVYSAMGSPAAMTFVGPEEWFYITARGRVFAFFDPKFSEYRIIRVRFGSGDSVSDIGFNDISGKSFDTAEARTELPSEIAPGFFEELFGNIGRFNAAGMTAAQ